MNALNAKVREVGSSLLPIIILVILLIIGPVSVSFQVLARFLIGALCLFFGLSIFLWGVEQSMNPIGYHMATEVATSKGLTKAALIAFFMGFLVTVAEPDLLILGKQVESASGGQLGSKFLVLMVSLGVGLMISLGAIRTLKSRRYNLLMAITYAIIFVLACFVSEEFMAISFDASGATTGALTTPFILALSIGLSRLKGSQHAEEDSFGLVGAMSAGPIWAVMLISILSGQKKIHGEALPFVPGTEIFAPIVKAIGPTLLESLAALLPVTLLFFIFERSKFRLDRRELLGIIRGLIYSLLGLTLFILGAETGFMDMGRLLGMGLAEHNAKLLPFVGLAMGLIVVLAEPAVHVLGEQIEEVTSGHIPLRVIRLTLSIGVGLAISLSMVRIMFPAVKLWYFIIPGFILAIILSFIAEPIFVGIAYDAGGVASGPMSATFVLAFAQGAAAKVPTADVLVDGFGIIAMIAMAPVLSLMILGTYFKLKRKRHEARPQISSELLPARPDLKPQSGVLKDLILVICDRGYADELVSLARTAGAHGATILHGRDSRAEALSRFSISVEPEKELILLVVSKQLTEAVMDSILDSQKSGNKNHIISSLVLPVSLNSKITSQLVD
ncbi:MAG: DUF1538 domain-containing protein [Eubacteriales bacterium]|nr:DUF1538 domain-containing protein [Eubacteriales bacterium]